MDRAGLLGKVVRLTGKCGERLGTREGAILQSFPKDYKFVKPDGDYSFKTIGRMIGNAVPVRLGEIVGKTITVHLRKYHA